MPKTASNWLAMLLTGCVLSATGIAFAALPRKASFGIRCAAMQTTKILLSWFLIAGGSCFFFSGYTNSGAHVCRRKGIGVLEIRVHAQSLRAGWRDHSVRLGVAPCNSRRRSFRAPLDPAPACRSLCCRGTDSADLRRGPGHLEGSALPGSNGNCVIAGHRDTHFRLLKNVRQGTGLRSKRRPATLFIASRESPLLLQLIPPPCGPPGSPC